MATYEKSDEVSEGLLLATWYCKVLVAVVGDVDVDGVEVQGGVDEVGVGDGDACHLTWG